MEVFRMPVNLSIKNAPDDLVALLKQQAQRNHRSLQGEVLAIIEEAVRRPKRLTALQLLAEVKKLDFETPSESAEIIRKMRDERYGG
jgi:plasmid stability protein